MEISLENKYRNKHKKSTDYSAFFIDYEIVAFSKITISERFVVETRCA